MEIFPIILETSCSSYHLLLSFYTWMLRYYTLSYPNHSPSHPGHHLKGMGCEGGCGYSNFFIIIEICKKYTRDKVQNQKTIQFRGSLYSPPSHLSRSYTSLHPHSHLSYFFPTFSFQIYYFYYLFSSFNIMSCDCDALLYILYRFKLFHFIPLYIHISHVNFYFISLVFDMRRKIKINKHKQK